VAPTTRAAALLAALFAASAWADVAPALPGEKASSDKPKGNTVIQKYYAEALQYYVHGDYRQAIIKWNAIVKEAPEQTTAPEMILAARKKILILTKERRARTFQYIAAGQYEKAFIELQDLLDQDPGDPQLQALQSRLDHVRKLAPALFARNKAARAAVLGLKGYLTLPPDLTLAHNGLRYAGELAPDDEKYAKFLAIVFAEFPVLATLDPVTPGMKFLEYKHHVALHQIYDGKYHAAVLSLDEILALDPDDLTALKRLGSAYYSLGRMEEARGAWTAALKISPKDKTLKRFIAKTRAPAAKKPKKAAETP
jgi:tetratricopeptide (TPR) repeat protein